MTLLLTLLLAQALTHHGKAVPTPAPSPEVRITIVNATSIPAISLTTLANSTASKGNHPTTYPYFPQGRWTGDEPLKSTSIDYLARMTNGLIISEKKFTFQPVSSQILLLTGDLSTVGPPEILPQIGTQPFSETKPWAPNFQFHIYPCSTATNDLCRYRVVNAMPSKVMTIRTPSEGNKPSQQLAILAPGNSALFIKQSANLHWEVEIDGKIYPLEMEQEDERKNCLIPFFLQNGVPSFIRVFENP